MIFTASLKSAHAVGTGGAGWGLLAPPLNVLAFIQTDAAPVLFQIHPLSCLSSPVRHQRASVENKIAVHPVLTHEASLIGGSL
jgi:hypothetical protein